MQEGRMQKEWRMGLIVPIWKSTGDVHDPGKYRGITLAQQSTETAREGFRRKDQEKNRRWLRGEQQGSRKRRGTADGMYVLRQMVEKILEVHGSMALGFVDLTLIKGASEELIWGQDWTQTWQRAEPAAVYISTGPHKQEDGDEGCHEETPLCRRPGPGGEWQTGTTGNTGGVERAVYLTRAEDKHREDGSAAHV